jgi:diacylglycerol kinase
MNNFRTRIVSTKRSFGYAFEGIGYALKTQGNLRIHLVIAVIILAVSVILHCTLVEIAIILLISALIISLELMNTSIETVVDMISPHSQPLAKIAKDLGAASVLVAAAGAVIIGLLILGTKLLVLINPLWIIK